MQVSLDFETRSTIDLRKVGVYVYAESLTTDVWCLAWAIDDAEPELWVLGEPFPPRLADAIAAGAELRAWNAQFERVIWNTVCAPQYGWPTTTREQWHDTAAEAAAMGLPRALGQAAQVLGVSEQKDDPGYQFVLRMARPRSTRGGKIVWWTDPDRLERLYTYCRQDVRTERAIGRVVRRLGKRERQVYLLDQEINDRGALIDAKLANAIEHISERAMEDANAALYDATGGEVGDVKRVIDLREWLVTQGVEVDSVRKAVVRDLLAGDGLAPHVRGALIARQEAGKSSVAKARTAKRVRCADGRARGLLLYHGANTGRWSGKLLQPQNFPRGDLDYRPYLDLIMAREYDLLNAFAPPLTVTSAALRGLFIASPGHRLMVGDYAQIEARVLAWIAGQQDQLALFRAGKSPYPPMADAIYGLPPGTIESLPEPKLDPRYKTGKDTVLGCGYGMGADKFRQQIMEKDGHDVGEELAQLAVRTYRSTMTEIVQTWYDVGDAAMDAVKNPGSVQESHRAKFTYRGKYLWLVLPSGRPLAYAKPKIEMRRVPWHREECTDEKCVEHERRPSVMAWNVDSITKRWVKRALYGGLLVENIVQALARDLMADGMLRLRAAGYPTILTVHDEIIADVPNDHGTLDEFVQLAHVGSTWATDCPTGFEAWEGDRFRKA